MHDLNVVIFEERVDRINKEELILYSRRRTIRIQSDPEKPVDYSHIKVTTINCKDDKDISGDKSYLIRIKAYRGRGGGDSGGGGGKNKKKDLIKSSSI